MESKSEQWKKKKIVIFNCNAEQLMKLMFYFSFSSSSLFSLEISFGFLFRCFVYDYILYICTSHMLLNHLIKKKQKWTAHKGTIPRTNKIIIKRRKKVDQIENWMCTIFFVSVSIEHLNWTINLFVLISPKTFTSSFFYF